MIPLRVLITNPEAVDDLATSSEPRVQADRTGRIARARRLGRTSSGRTPQASGRPVSAVINSVPSAVKPPCFVTRVRPRVTSPKPPSRPPARLRGLRRGHHAGVRSVRVKSSPTKSKGWSASFATA